jgi:formylglycine-generating enzyme required for sulfatase activity
MVVDTDLSVPEYASAFQLDIYSNDGIWYDSRSIVLPTPDDWPASFSLYSPEGSAEALVRLRVYPREYTRDYQGELPLASFVGEPPLEPASEPEPTGQPRLIKDGVDCTPFQEPQPLVTSDRLLRLRLTPGVVGSVRVLVRGECVGTMVDMDAHTTCVDRAGVRVPAELASPQPLDEGDLGGTEAGRFSLPEPCQLEPRPGSHTQTAIPLFDEEVCVPGGPFHLGTEDNDDANSRPVRMARIQPFLIDKYEVTVARWRDAMARGFAPDPDWFVVNDGPLTDDLRDSTACTYTSIEGARETHPMNCLIYDLARAFCQFEGGDLPTEAQWEYAASVAEGQYESSYPWGSEPPDCSRAVLMRWPRGDWGECASLGAGAQPVDVADHEGGDRTRRGGIVGMEGGVSEYARDVMASLGSNCWMANGLDDPSCQPDTSSKVSHALRGSSWAEGAKKLDTRGEMVANAVGSFAGFRCVRRGRP